MRLGQIAVTRPQIAALLGGVSGSKIVDYGRRAGGARWRGDQPLLGASPVALDEAQITPHHSTLRPLGGTLAAPALQRPRHSSGQPEATQQPVKNRENNENETHEQDQRHLQRPRRSRYQHVPGVVQSDARERDCARQRKHDVKDQLHDALRVFASTDLRSADSEPDMSGRVGRICSPARLSSSRAIATTASSAVSKYSFNQSRAAVRASW